MKTLQLIACLVVFILPGAGCKRVVFCKNTCLTCYHPKDVDLKFVFCDAPSDPILYEQLIEDYEMLGFVCKESLPSKIHKVQGNPKEVNETVKAIESTGMKCYDKSEYDPDYFDHEKFKANALACQACYDTIAKHYLVVYFDTIGKYTQGFCADCIGPDFLKKDLPGIIAYAAGKVEHMHCGYANTPKITLNVGSVFNAIPFDTTLSQVERENWVKLGLWTDFNSVVREGFKAPIFRDCKEPWWP